MWLGEVVDGGLSFLGGAMGDVTKLFSVNRRRQRSTKLSQLAEVRREVQRQMGYRETHISLISSKVH